MMKARVYPGVQETVWTGITTGGLPVVVCPKPGYHKTFAMLAVNYGSVDLRADPEGVAHFLEHKMFDMPDGTNALQRFTQTGASPNAYTSHAMTAYHFECTHALEENLRTLLAFVSTPYFTPESVEKEQGIIGQEIDMTEDTPGFKLFCDFFEALYAHHPIRASIIGTKESIAQITAKTLTDCHRDFYRPANMVLCVAGAAAPDQVLALAEEGITAHPEAAETRRDYGAPEPPGPVQTHTERKMAVASPLFMLGAKLRLPARGILRHELLWELACETLAGPSSPLYERLYGQGILNKSFSAGPYRFPGGMALVFSGESPDPAAFREALTEELDRVGQEGLDAALFARIQKAALGGRVWGLDSPSRLCRDLAAGHFLGEDPLDFPAWFAELTPEDGTRLLRTELTKERLALSVIVP